MAIAGYEKNTEQCRQKCKKLRAEYRKAFAKISRASDVAASIRDMQASDERRQEWEEERLDRRHRVAREEALTGCHRC
ncbi:unnamed protein product [Arctogadus glacialis]